MGAKSSRLAIQPRAIFQEGAAAGRLPRIHIDVFFDPGWIIVPRSPGRPGSGRPPGGRGALKVTAPLQGCTRSSRICNP
ncbi:MAG: hypothetical protein GY859_03755 [Desulfobacterales bacterium]|nr:hypothetical protein [Desulfobacterales bacterium]